MSYPKTALEALNQIKALPDHGFLDFMIERECYGAVPYLSGKTDQGWCVLWSVEMLDYNDCDVS
jgi:hypothetical protein